MDILKMTQEQLIAYSQHHTDTSSLYGYLLGVDKREIFLSLFDHLNLNFMGKRVLDMGPGTGDALDIARERGAVSTHFIDRDPLLFRYCENKGHSGYICDWGTSQIHAIANSFDIIICKGSLNADQWNRGGFEIPFSELLGWMGRSGTVIITPTFDRGEATGSSDETLNGANTHYHTCMGDRYREYLKSMFHLSLMDAGYMVLPFIEGYSHPHCFPFTYQYLFEK